jgi:hypothetical protein
MMTRLTVLFLGIASLFLGIGNMAQSVRIGLLEKQLYALQEKIDVQTEGIKLTNDIEEIREVLTKQIVFAYHNVVKEYMEIRERIDKLEARPAIGNPKNPEPIFKNPH